MEALVKPGFRVIRGPDWSYKNQDGGKGHAGTVLRHHDVGHTRPNFPKHSVQVQWDNGDKGLYRVGYDQAFDLRIIDTANTVCHPKIWCDGCNADEIKGMRWRCIECYAIDLCTTCYMNDEHDLSHIFMRVLTSDKTSMGPKMLPRSSSPRIALRGSFPGANVVRYPQWYKEIGPDTKVGKVVKDGQTAEDRVKVQAVVEFICTPERVDITKISCTLSGSGGHVYQGHLPNLGDPEPVSEGDTVLATATSAELEKLHKRRGLWDPNMLKVTGRNPSTFRMKGFVNRRTNSGDFKVTFNDSQETFTMNSAALTKLHPLSPGQLVRINDDIDMVKRLQFGHGGWTAAMKKELGKVGKVVKIDGLDVHVNINGDHKFTFNSASLTPARICPAETSRDTIQCIMQHAKEPGFSLIFAVDNDDISAVENILMAHPDWVNIEVRRGWTPLRVACAKSANMVKFLVEKGAFINGSESTQTPLISATNVNNFEAVKFLLEQGANVDAVNFQGFTSLATACHEGFFESAHSLLVHGADINQKGEEGLTPVLLSLDCNRRKGRNILDLVLDRKEADLKTVSSTLLSTIHFASPTTDNTHALTKLLDRVPRLVDARDEHGNTPIFKAAEKGSLKAAELLIKKGRCNVNTLDDETGLSTLGVATLMQHFHLVDLLVKNGADPNLSNHLRMTPMHIAINDHFSSSNDSQLMEEAPFMAEASWINYKLSSNEKMTSLKPFDQESIHCIYSQEENFLLVWS